MKRALEAHAPGLDHLHPAYLAGIIDGEGSIFVHGRTPEVSVANTNRALIDELARFPGCYIADRTARGMGTRTCWEWRVGGERAAIVIRTCLPWLIVKRERALEVLRFWQTVQGTHHAHHVAKIQRQYGELGWPGIRLAA